MSACYSTSVVQSWTDRGNGLLFICFQIVISSIEEHVESIVVLWTYLAEIWKSPESLILIFQNILNVWMLIESFMPVQIRRLVIFCLD